MTSSSDKLEALRRREAAVKAAIAAEKVREQKRKEKIETRLFAIVGEILTRHAEQSPDFRLMLMQVLNAADLRDGDRAFLVGNGWL